MKRIAINQPYLFPYIGYFQLISAVDKFVCYDDVNYIKQGWINRNRILNQGRPLFFTVPIREQSSFRTIAETQISSKEMHWREKLIKTLVGCYGKAPFFNEVFPLIEGIVRFPTESISEFTVEGLVRVARHLGIATEIVRSSSRYKNSELRATKRVVDICRQEEATIYVNAPGGQELYRKEDFQRHGFDLRFLKTGEFSYPQSGTASFIPQLSIIDVLMFNSLTEVQGLLKEYVLT